MKSDKIESLVSWFFTGGILLVVGFYMLWESWRAIHLGVPFTYHGHQADPEITMGGSILLVFLGVSLIVSAVIAKLRSLR